MARGRHWQNLWLLLSGARTIESGHISMIFVMLGFASMGIGVSFVACEYADKYSAGEREPPNAARLEETEATAPAPEPAPEPEKYPTMARLAEVPEPAPPTHAANAADGPEINIEAERAAVQERIKAAMARMREAESINAGDNAESAADAETPSLSAKREHAEDSAAAPILTPMKFGKHQAASQKSPDIEMHFPTIGEDLNEQIENDLISAGFKLLSEIRIGATGVDYLAAAADGIALIQADPTTGEWLANEDSVDGSAPQWFSADKAKTSPAHRAYTARDTISKLIADASTLPITAYAYIPDSTILNREDMTEIWHDAGVNVITRREFKKLLAEQTKTEPDPEEMQRIIDALEAAEVP